MASGDTTRLDDHTKLQKISTAEILHELKQANGDNTNFFYLYVSTADTERKRQRKRQLPPGQQTLDNYVNEDSDDSESEEELGDSEQTDENTLESNSQPVLPPVQDNSVTQNSPPLPSSSLSNREAAMNKVHEKVLPKVLHPDGWRKVHDKDMKITYRALYFNIIRKQPDEDDKSHVLRVAKIRTKICHEVDKIKTQHGVNFRINSLLSKPILYDVEALEERSARESSAPEKRCSQTEITEYFQAKRHKPDK